MRTSRLVMIAAVLACGTSAVAHDIAPGGTLRAVYLGTNPAQAMRDPATGQVRGPAYDLARELARRNNVPLEFKPIASPPAVIEAVNAIERGGAIGVAVAPAGVKARISEEHELLALSERGLQLRVERV